MRNGGESGNGERLKMSTGKICDRYHTARNVESYQILLFEVEGKKLVDRKFDLSPRGLAWLKNLIENDIAKLDVTEEAGHADA